MGQTSRNERGRDARGRKAILSFLGKEEQLTARLALPWLPAANRRRRNHATKVPGRPRIPPHTVRQSKRSRQAYANKFVVVETKNQKNQKTKTKQNQLRKKKKKQTKKKKKTKQKKKKKVDLIAASPLPIVIRIGSVLFLKAISVVDWLDSLIQLVGGR